MTTDFDTIDFFTDESLVPDPYPYFDHLREQGPITKLPHHGVYAVTGYDAAARVLRDAEHFSSCNSVTGPFPGFSEPPPDADDVNDFIAAHRHEQPMSEYMITQDPPTHHEHRGIIMRLFTPKRVREKESVTRALADRQIDTFLDGGRFEVASDFGQPFAASVIIDLLGIPEEDHVEFKSQLIGGPPAPEVGADTTQVVHDPLAYMSAKLTGYLEDRRRNPRGDVLTHLATATLPDGSSPPVEVLVNLASFLFSAGQHTTAMLVTNALRVIAERPDIQERLRGDIELIPNFIDEVLRHDSIVKAMARTARVTTTVDGVRIPAGTTVSIMPGAANRDPSRFEAPGEFRLGRSNADEHLSFGRGIHACPGGPLARLEAVVSIEQFLTRTSDIRIDEEHHGPPGARRFEFDPIYVLRTLRELHLEVTAS